MKKSIYILSILLAGALIAMLSCSKEEVQISKKQHLNDPDAIKAYNRIMHFKDKIANYQENPLFKSGEIISIDSLLWEFNAALNFDYSFVDDPYKEFYSKPTYVQLSIDANGMVNMDEAADVYLQLITDIQNTLDEAPFSEKAVQFTYISTVGIEDQTISLKSKTTVGNKGIDTNGPFGSDDDWMYGDDLGDCYGNYITERDGGDEIRDMVESRRHLFINDQGIAVFYVNPVKIIINKDDIDYNPLLDLTNGQGYDNIRDYRIFYAHDDHCQGTTLSDFECINNNDMNFYLYQMEDLVYNTIPNQPTYWAQAEGKYFVRFDTINGTLLNDGAPLYKNYIIHIPEIIFAERKTIEQ